ncbi:MAG: alanine:cation symporter family protein [Clostridia bacterium]|nr:alanine:cation symporter family protein [Clostridia bacterium]
MLETISKIVNVTNDALYTYILIIMLVAAGIYFTVRTRFAPFRLFGEQIRAVTEKNNGNGVSSFQALMISTASRVGTGNIVGVSTAICLGGFGSVFWMWVIAIIGSASAFVESTLAQIYKRKGPDGCYGGPAYYIESALKNRTLAVVFSVLLIITYGFGFNMLASYNLQDTFSTYGFYNKSTTPWIIGAVIAVIVCYCLIGGGKRIAKITSLLVPVMGVAYVVISLIIVVLNIKFLPDVFARIFREAFDFKSIFGGFTGSCVMLGIKRGLFSNEAGIGSAPNASASAEVSHPAKQGLVQVLSVFIDTILICSATAFMCMFSGVEPTEEIAGAVYVQQAIASVFGKFGPIFITVAMALFAFTTLIGNLYYVDKCVIHIAGKIPSKKARVTINVISSLIIFAGAGLSADLLWGIADVTMGAMAVINIPVIIILGKHAFNALKDYEKQRKAGKDPVFKAANIGLGYTSVDCWK